MGDCPSYQKGKDRMMVKEIELLLADLNETHIELRKNAVELAHLEYASLLGSIEQDRARLQNAGFVNILVWLDKLQKGAKQ